MDKHTIKNNLSEDHHSFIAFVGSLTDDAFVKSSNEKWTAGQQLEHIYRSVKPLSLVLRVPKFLLRLFWVQANRKSRSYDELVKKYKASLEKGGRAMGRFVPKQVGAEQKQSLQYALTKEVSRLCARVDLFSEDDLDRYILPHPLLGKLTIREMLYFTIYHVKHHEELTKRNLDRY